MINIESISYRNENGELITVNFEETEVQYRADRIHDLVREMIAGGRDIGPPPRRTENADALFHGGEY